MFTPYGHYRPKLGWGALGDFGADVPSYAPPSGRSILEGPTLVTEDNRQTYAVGTEEAPSCASRGVEIARGTTTLWVPPTGWYGVLISDANGYSRPVWIDPGSNTAYDMKDCTGTSAGVTEKSGTTWEPLPSDLSGLLVFGGIVVGGLVLYKAFSKKRGASRHKK